MPCYHPIKAWYGRTKTEKGRRPIVFNRRDAYHTGAQLTVPCGQCIGCRLERSRQWAMRCLHEASLYRDNCFITLTYNDDHLPSDLSLHKEDFQKFMKRLRKANPDNKIRYYQAGEYGELNARPHYHACLFNFDFDDKVFWAERGGNRLYTSQSLDRIWGKGYCIVGEVTFDSAAYVARYILKKVLGGSDEYRESVYAGREPEYSTMSRRPGIGRQWFDTFEKDVYPHDYVVIRGQKVRPPKYYDTIYAEHDISAFEGVKAARKGKIRELVPLYERLAGVPSVVANSTPDRLEVKEFIKKDVIEKSLKREI